MKRLRASYRTRFINHGNPVECFARAVIAVQVHKFANRLPATWSRKMRDNSFDRTIERNYLQKWRFLIAGYETVKAGRSDEFRRPGVPPASRHLLAVVPQVLQPLSGLGRGGCGALTAAAQPQMEGAARSKRVALVLAERPDAALHGNADLAGRL
jgi:hypothetical protein